MPHRALSRSAVRAGVVVVSLAALATGGSAVALQTVSLSSPSLVATTTGPATPTPAPTVEREPDGKATDKATAEADDTAGATGPGKPEVEPVGEDRTKARGKAERKQAKDAAKAQRRAGTPGTVPLVEFTCDPSRSHGQNVSAYAHSLPKGPGRGRLVSQAARSDCGKGKKGTTGPHD